MNKAMLTETVNWRSCETDPPTAYGRYLLVTDNNGAWRVGNMIYEPQFVDVPNKEPWVHCSGLVRPLYWAPMLSGPVKPLDEAEKHILLSALCTAIIYSEELLPAIKDLRKRFCVQYDLTPPND